MGNKGPYIKPGTCKIHLDRYVFQAGNFVHGQIQIEIGEGGDPLGA